MVVTGAHLFQAVHELFKIKCARRCLIFLWYLLLKLYLRSSTGIARNSEGNFTYAQQDIEVVECITKITDLILEFYNHYF